MAVHKKPYASIVVDLYSHGGYPNKIEFKYKDGKRTDAEDFLYWYFMCGLKELIGVCRTEIRSIRETR